MMAGGCWAHPQRPGVLHKETSSGLQPPTPSPWLVSKPRVNLFLEGGGAGAGTQTPPGLRLLVRWHWVLRPVQGCSLASRSGIAVPPATGLDTASRQRGAEGGCTAPGPAAAPMGRPAHRRWLPSAHRLAPLFQHLGDNVSHLSPPASASRSLPVGAAGLSLQELRASSWEMGPDSLPLWPRAVRPAPQSLALTPSPRPSLCLMLTARPPGPTVPELARPVTAAPPRGAQASKVLGDTCPPPRPGSA